jgi:hypothetical protein
MDGLPLVGAGVRGSPTTVWQRGWLESGDVSSEHQCRVDGSAGNSEQQSHREKAGHLACARVTPTRRPTGSPTGQARLPLILIQFKLCVRSAEQVWLTPTVSRQAKRSASGFEGAS